MKNTESKASKPKFYIAHIMRDNEVCFATGKTLEEYVEEANDFGASNFDLFSSTTNKIAAFDLYNKWLRKEGSRPASYGRDSKDEYLNQFIYFIFNSPINADFIRFCAKEEGYDNEVKYFMMLLSC